MVGQCKVQCWWLEHVKYLAYSYLWYKYEQYAQYLKLTQHIPAYRIFSALALTIHNFYFVMFQQQIMSFFQSCIYFSCF